MKLQYNTNVIFFKQLRIQDCIGLSWTSWKFCWTLIRTVSSPQYLTDICLLQQVLPLKCVEAV